MKTKIKNWHKIYYFPNEKIGTQIFKLINGEGREVEVVILKLLKLLTLASYNSKINIVKLSWI